MNPTNLIILAAYRLAEACEGGHCVSFAHARELFQILTAALKRDGARPSVRQAAERLVRAFGPEVFHLQKEA